MTIRTVAYATTALLWAVCYVGTDTGAAGGASKIHPGPQLPSAPLCRQSSRSPYGSNWDHPPTTPEGWKQLSDSIATTVAPTIAPMAERLHVTVQPTTINGVRAYTITPTKMPEANRNRLAIHVHGGCYVLNPREAVLPEAMMLAGFARMKVISVDYRMPPEAYFPAALDDAMTVYKAVLKTTER